MIDELLRGYHFLRRRLMRELGPHDGEDLAQAAFERALCYAREHKVISPVGLIFQIATNLQADRGRRRQYETIVLEKEPEVVWEVTPECEYTGQQTAEKLCSVLDNLPPRCREAFVLCRLQGMSYHAAAAKMGVSPAVVRQYLIEAKEACRQAIS
ncbi:hypothetical protein WT25_20225 [Burkholderia territorii]|uniref:RNA polymerase sigma factor n=1 Tax=Burkholderia territorii TaxID=1503055 RepID=UPI00075AF136|nr:RNA polymerase sigma factor [Burkholderia territorii]KVT78863.1 hypothetical protein WT25_20225 [Burkholderia territorii]